MKLAIVAISAAVLAGLAVAAERFAPDRERDEPDLTIDTPFEVLLDDEQTGPVLRRDLPILVERFERDDSFADRLSGSTPRDLTLDPRVAGVSAELLARLARDLAEAQRD